MDCADKHIVEYGIQLMLNTSLKVVIILIVGNTLGHFKEVVIAMSVFGGIRYFEGGYHCKTDIGCLSVMLLASLSPILFFGIEVRIAQYIWRMIIVYSLYETIRYAPRNSKVNPIYDLQILSRKRSGSIIVVGIASIFIIIYPQNNVCWLVVIPMFIESVSISPIFYGKKGIPMGK